MNNIEDWEFSNYLDWIGKRNGGLADKDFIKKYFPVPELYSKFVLDYYSDKQAADEMKKYRNLMRL